MSFTGSFLALPSKETFGQIEFLLIHFFVCILAFFAFPGTSEVETFFRTDTIAIKVVSDQIILCVLPIKVGLGLIDISLVFGVTPAGSWLELKDVSE